MQQAIVLAAFLAGSVAALPWGPDGNWGNDGNWGPPADQNSAWPESGAWPSMTWTGRPEWAGPSASGSPAMSSTVDALSTAAPSVTTMPVISDDSDISTPVADSTTDLDAFSAYSAKPSTGLFKPKSSPNSDAPIKSKSGLKPTGFIKSTHEVKPTGSLKPTSATAKNQVAPKPTLTRPNSALGTAPVYSSLLPKQSTISTSVAAPVYSSLLPKPSTTSTSAAVATPSSTGTASTGNAYSDMVLAHHNVHRANHSANALAWDSNLASTAEKIAKSCKFAHDTSMDKSLYKNGYGQNIQAGTAAADVWEAITNSFYNGEVNAFAGSYGQANPTSNFENWGHFSQVVWKDTTAVGCATVHCPNGVEDGVGTKDFTVCNYTPAGNFGGEYANNIGKPLNQPTVNTAQVSAQAGAY